MRVCACHRTFNLLEQFASSLLSPIGLPGAGFFVAFGVYCHDVAVLFRCEFTKSKARTYTLGFAIGSAMFLISATVDFMTGIGFALGFAILGALIELAFIPMMLALPTYLKSKILECVQNVANDAKPDEAKVVKYFGGKPN